jgi:sporulation protein YlmC with PRC-barrel domain
MDISYERVQAVGDILLITPAPQPKDAQEITVNS